MCLCRFVCHGLTTGESYVFRVRAVNAAGISEFSQESEAIEVKAAIGESSVNSYWYDLDITQIYEI